jgi:hypothetical protein
MATKNDGITLFMTGWAPTLNTYTTLHMFGASVPGAEFIEEAIPLFIEGTPFFNTRTLYVEGHDPLGPERSNSITLFLHSSPIVSSAIPLYAEAPDGINEWLRLSIKGTGQNAGFFPVGEGIPLFINRVNEVHTIPLFCKAVDGEVNTYAPLYTEGVTLESDSITLVIAGMAPVNSYVTLVCWNDPVAINTFIPLLVLGVVGVEVDYITLAMPATHSDILNSVTFYADGH